MEKYLMRGKNKFLVISFITTLLIYFVYILEFYNVISNVANISTIAFAALSIIISVFFETPIVKSISHENNVILPKNNMANKNIFTGLVDYKSINNTCNFLQRQSHRDNLKSMVKIKQNLKHEINGIFVTGESGAGKSILMQLLANDLRCEYNVIVKQDEYNHFWDIIIDKESDKTIIIFDGFEKSLDYDNLFCDWCEKNKGILKKCVFIFSFPQLYLSRVYNQISNISNDTHLKTYILNLDENDETDYLAKITRLLSVSQEKVTTVWKNMQKGLDVCQDKENYYINLFCKELLKIKRGQSPLIQIEFLAEVANVKEIKDDDFINEYFDHWVSQFENETTAYSILTLFSEYRKYKESDIQLLTFVNSKELIQIKNILSNAPFLHISNALECTFEPKHRYVSEVIRHYISNKEVPNGEKSYIEYYNKYSKKEKYHTYLNERYDLYYKKHRCDANIYAVGDIYDCNAYSSTGY